MTNSAKGADARCQTAEELASPLGGALEAVTVLRGFLNRAGRNHFGPTGWPGLQKFRDAGAAEDARHERRESVMEDKGFYNIQPSEDTPIQHCLTGIFSRSMV